MSATKKWPTWDQRGQMRPALPKRIAEALAHLRAMTEPYFDSDTANLAEQALRIAIRDALKDAKRKVSP